MTTFGSFLDPFLAILAEIGLKPAGFRPLLPEITKMAEKRPFLTIFAISGQFQPKTGWFLTIFAKNVKNHHFDTQGW